MPVRSCLGVQTAIHLSFFYRSNVQQRWIKQVPRHTIQLQILAKTGQFERNGAVLWNVTWKLSRILRQPINHSNPTDRQTKFAKKTACWRKKRNEKAKAKLYCLVCAIHNRAARSLHTDDIKTVLHKWKLFWNNISLADTDSCGIELWTNKWLHKRWQLPTILYQQTGTEPKCIPDGAKRFSVGADAVLLLS